MHNLGRFQLIWLKLGMETQNGTTQHVFLIYKDFSMLTGQTSLPPKPHTTLKVDNMHNLGRFQPIWLKLGIET